MKNIDDLNAILFHAYSEVMDEPAKAVKDPVKNVHFDSTIIFDHEKAFPFLQSLGLSQDSINYVNIQNAASLYAIMILGDEMGVFKVADAVLKYVTMGKVDIQTSETSTRLYNYMKLRDQRTTEDERAMFYKQVFDIGEGRVMNDMASNTQFGGLWDTLMNEVVKYITKYEKLDNPENVSKSGIEQAIFNLQHNLARAASGMIKLYVPEMYAHLEDAMQILGAEEITNQLGHGIARDVWNVLENVNIQEFNYMPNISGLRTIAQTGRDIILAVSKYSSVTFSDEEFEEFIRDVESFVIAQSQVTDGSYGEGEEEDIEDIEDEMESMEEDWDF
jgi:hypothetical protein